MLNGLSVANIPIESHGDGALQSLLAECNSCEQESIALRKHGVTEPSRYAEALGMAHCSIEEQECMVKVMKRRGNVRAVGEAVSTWFASSFREDLRRGEVNNEKVPRSRSPHTHQYIVLLNATRSIR